MTEEPFGPVASVAPFRSVEDAIFLSNKYRQRPAVYVFTQRPDMRDAIVAALQCGVIGVNRFSVSAPRLPFGGVKDSGGGREGGYKGIRAFQTSKGVLQ